MTFGSWTRSRRQCQFYFLFRLLIYIQCQNIFKRILLPLVTVCGRVKVKKKKNGIGGIARGPITSNVNIILCTKRCLLQVNFRGKRNSQNKTELGSNGPPTLINLLIELIEKSAMGNWWQCILHRTLNFGSLCWKEIIKNADFLYLRTEI